MKHRFSKVISFITAMMLVMQMCAITSAATQMPMASDYLSAYDGTVTSEGNGKIKVSFTVVGTGILDEIGASRIVIEKKTGSYWIPVKTYTLSDYPELATDNDYSYGSYVLYQGEEGKYYRAEITVFGGPDSRTFFTTQTKA